MTLIITRVIKPAFAGFQVPALCSEFARFFVVIRLSILNKRRLLSVGMHKRALSFSCLKTFFSKITRPLTRSILLLCLIHVRVHKRALSFRHLETFVSKVTWPLTVWLLVVILAVLSILALPGLLPLLTMRFFLFLIHLF